MKGVLRAIGATVFSLASALPWGAAVHAATPAELEREVQRFAVACAKNDAYPDLYDCRCLTDGYRKAVQETGSRFRRRALVRDYKLLQQCPASKSSIAAWFRRECISNAPAGAGHGEFCNCGAEVFSSAFRVSPPASKGAIETLERESMRSCGRDDKLPLKHPRIDIN
ncbi:MAG: hypothetical protein J7549_08970 [Variovorax sp.]|nr:hypothetical protein [Variovorax sp.]